MHFLRFENIYKNSHKRPSLWIRRSNANWQKSPLWRGNKCVHITKRQWRAFFFPPTYSHSFVPSQNRENEIHNEWYAAAPCSSRYPLYQKWQIKMKIRSLLALYTRAMSKLKQSIGVSQRAKTSNTLCSLQIKFICECIFRTCRVNCEIKRYASSSQLPPLCIRAMVEGYNGFYLLVHCIHTRATTEYGI